MKNSQSYAILLRDGSYLVSHEGVSFKIFSDGTFVHTVKNVGSFFVSLRKKKHKEEPIPQQLLDITPNVVSFVKNLLKTGRNPNDNLRGVNLFKDRFFEPKTIVETAKGGDQLVILKRVMEAETAA